MKIILIIFWLVGIINLLLTNDYSIIYSCGLFGFIGNEPQTYFNWDKFNILGYFNDKRGGVSDYGFFEKSFQHGDTFVF